MTEAEWLTSRHPMDMLICLYQLNPSLRKLILFSVENKRIVDQYGDVLPIINDVLESFAEGKISEDELNSDFLRLRGYTFGGIAIDSIHEWIRSSEPMKANHRLRAIRHLRDIFGNPFRPVSFDPAWLTPTVVALAYGIYGDRAFDRMPILADALEEAGCDNVDVLLHCRGDGPHVRGCWVVDAVLGKK